MPSNTATAAATAAAEAAADQARIAVLEGQGVQLTMYLASGKVKHERWFWLERARLCWDKRPAAERRGAANKKEKLLGVEPSPAIRSASEWFKMIDADGTGALAASELQTLYKKALGKKLKGRELTSAMTEMDTSGDNQIELAEFEAWWSKNGGELETNRDRALTITAGDVTHYVVAKTVQEKDAVVQGLTAKLRAMGKPPGASATKQNEVPATKNTAGDPAAAVDPAPTPAPAPAPVHVMDEGGEWVERVIYCPVGTRVQRGLDWYWDDQDGGEQVGGEGVVLEEPDEDGWSRIFWEATGIDNSFNNGADGMEDVEPATPKPKPTTTTTAAPNSAAKPLGPKQLTIEQCRAMVGLQLQMDNVKPQPDEWIDALFNEFDK